jgi:Mob1/phocein family protein
VALFNDDPPCSATTCNEMRASEWQYLCAVHDPPKPCCAIDYCCHTLDWAANVLTSQKHFPSRMGLGPEQSASHQQLRQLTNIFRRVYRIFAHAWFQHREVFWKVESKTGLYVFFKTVSDAYSLIPTDNYTVPPEAEGRGPAPEDSKDKAKKPTIEIPPDNAESAVQSAVENVDQAQSDNDTSFPGVSSSLAPVNTAKRHRQTPSADVGTILTVLEENEEDDNGERKDVVRQAEEKQVQQHPLASTAKDEEIPIAVEENVNSEAPEPSEPVSEPLFVREKSSDEPSKKSEDQSKAVDSNTDEKLPTTKAKTDDKDAVDLNKAPTTTESSKPEDAAGPERAESPKGSETSEGFIKIEDTADEKIEETGSEETSKAEDSKAEDAKTDVKEEKATKD